jgi:hypothetical protein
MSIHAPSISVTYTHHASEPNELGMRPMQEPDYQKRGEQRIRCELPPFIASPYATLIAKFPQAYL